MATRSTTFATSPAGAPSLRDRHSSRSGPTPARRDRQPCDSTTTSRAVAASSWRARTLRARCRQRGRCRMRVRGAAPANKFEIKFVDPSGRNVWWWHRDAFDFPADWQQLRIRSSEVAFAWGPAGGGTMRELGALEIAIAAGPGGRGTVSVCDLRFEDLSLASLRRASLLRARPRGASRSTPSRPRRLRAGAAQTPRRPRGSRSTSAASTSMAVSSSTGRRPAPPARSKCSAPTTAPRGRRLRAATQAEGERSYVYLPGGGCSRHLRLFLHEPPAGGGPHEIRLLDVRPFDFSRSLADFFHAVAACEPRGHHPRWLHREQSYWTPAGIAGGTTAAVLNEEGLLEPDRGSFSLEPFLHVDGELITWADAEVSVSLAQGVLPIPSSTWRCGDLTLTITAFAAIESGRPQVRAVYRVSNAGPGPRTVRLFVALRPFQVSPPWQAFQGIGGMAQIRTPRLARRCRARQRQTSGSCREPRRADSAPPRSNRAGCCAIWRAA